MRQEKSLDSLSAPGRVKKAQRPARDSFRLQTTTPQCEKVRFVVNCCEHGPFRAKANRGADRAASHRHRHRTPPPRHGKGFAPFPAARRPRRPAPPLRGEKGRTLCPANPGQAAKLVNAPRSSDVHKLPAKPPPGPGTKPARRCAPIRLGAPNPPPGRVSVGGRAGPCRYGQGRIRHNPAALRPKGTYSVSSLTSAPRPKSGFYDFPLESLVSCRV